MWELKHKSYKKRSKSTLKYLLNLNNLMWDLTLTLERWALTKTINEN